MGEATYLMNRKEKIAMIKNDIEWKEFFLEDVVTIDNGVRLTKSDMEDGDTPFIGASEMNNGITAYCSNRNGSYDNNLLGVNYNGSVGFSFYHPYYALFSDDVKRVKWKDTFKNSKYTLLFLAVSIQAQKDKYAYGYKFNSQRMKRQKILLPINDKNEPDFAFMEAYLRAKEQEILKQTIKIINKNLTTIKTLDDTPYRKEWKDFVFGKAFSIESTNSSIDRIKLTVGNGEIPYITRSDTNNGIDSFILEQSKYEIDEGNAITIGLDTQTVFYQSKSFYTGQNIQVVRHPKLDRFNAIFLVVAIKKLVSKFSWGGYGATLTRLRKSKIYLPIDQDGEIDFEFMSTFMQRIEQDILRKTLPILKSKLSLT